MALDIEVLVQEVENNVNCFLRRLFLLSGFDELTEAEKRKRAEGCALALKRCVGTWGGRTDHPYLAQDLFYIEQAGFPELAKELAIPVVNLIVRYIKIKIPEHANVSDPEIRKIGVEALRTRAAFVFLILRHLAPEQEEAFRRTLAPEIEVLSAD